jgi:23S rRNA G2445 N2-methylase RlmL
MKKELAAKVAAPGFTPSVRQLADLLDLLSSDDDALVKDAERAILRIEKQYADRVARHTVEHARKATRPLRGRLTHLAGRLAQEGRDPEGVAAEWLLEAVTDDDPKTRRAAARGLGKLPPTKAIEDRLAKAFDQASSEDDRRVLALALGKTGSDAADERLSRGEYGRASLIASRERARRTTASIVPSASVQTPLRVWFHGRSGLEGIVEEELGRAVGKGRFVSPGVVEASLSGPLARALSVRTATHIGFPLTKAERTDDLAADIARAVCSDEALAIFRAFTSHDKKGEHAPIRFRLTFTRGGHRRSVVWRTAELVKQRGNDLVNDPTESTWEVVVDEVGGKVALELVPRMHDARFAYRQDLVAASSHPTIAAALARVAARRKDDVVWDPFVGAGAELVERALLGPYARLVGTDVDPRAIAAARANLDRAGVANATLEARDSTTYAPEGVTCIITNPPMGRRVHRGTHGELLERFVAHAADVLPPGGSLVWLVPEPRAVHARAATAGLWLERSISVDMGGFSAELEIWLKSAPRAQPATPKRQK